MNILYPIVHGFFYLLSLLPFRVLYVLADGLYLLIYRIIGYRKRVVRNNLTSSFPDKDIKEIKRIERGFYHFLCDYFMETLKLLSISPEKMLQHIEFRNVEEMEQCFDEGQACAAILGHYCNWEFLSTIGLAFKRHPDAVMGLIYHPLYNKVFDRLFIDLRQHLGGVCVAKKDILRHLLTYRRENKMSLFGYISDQTPKWNNIHLWLPFLNHDTPVFTNGEKIMRKMNNAVFYVDMERPRRGYYVVTFKLITRTPQQLEEHAITRRFFEMLEETIRRDPRFYLWSHNRWKRTHEEFDRRFEVINGKARDLHINNTKNLLIMKIINLSDSNSIINQYLAEIRDKDYQKNRLLFRNNIMRIGEMMAYEISKTLDYETKDIATPLGISKVNMPTDKIVLATIFRAGLPFHTGFLNVFDHAGNAFVSAYREYTDEEHHQVGIHVEYLATPSINEKNLIIADPMLATGGSMELGYKAFLSKGTPKRIHVCCVIATPEGLDTVRRSFPDEKTTIWCAAIDPGLNEHKYIVPGFGDAGDLCFGDKV